MLLKSANEVGFWLSEIKTAICDMVCSVSVSRGAQIARLTRVEHDVGRTERELDARRGDRSVAVAEGRLVILHERATRRRRLELEVGDDRGRQGQEDDGRGSHGSQRCQRGLRDGCRVAETHRARNGPARFSTRLFRARAVPPWARRGSSDIVHAVERSAKASQACVQWAEWRRWRTSARAISTRPQLVQASPDDL